ncbi:MAG: hypothetical protein P8Y70_21325 [Candidatus Lokiarchaeota archaeon]
MEILEEYKINDLISLKLEHGIWDLLESRWVEQLLDRTEEREAFKTRIYINDEPFLICSYILLVNPQLDDRFSDIDSIDDLKEILDGQLESSYISPKELGITPEEEFWAHCSNLEIWVENDYDMRILDSMLAFPILKKLKELGDLKAKAIFNEEVLKRYVKGGEVNCVFLEEDYFKDIPFEKQISIVENSDDYNALIMLHELIGDNFIIGYFHVDDGRVTELYLSDYLHEIDYVPEEIGIFEQLRKFEISLKKITSLPDSIGKLTNLKSLKIINCENIKKLPESIGNLENLEYLQIMGCKLIENAGQKTSIILKNNPYRIFK